MRFADLMARADDDTLRALVGPSALRVLRLFDESFDKPGVLRRTVLQIRSPDELLRDEDARRRLFDALPVDEADRLAAALGSTGGSPFAFLQDMSAAKGSAKERLLFGFFQVDSPEDPPREVPGTSLSSPSYALFPHQRNAVRETQAMLSATPHRVLLHMPTGAGKTRTAMSLIADFLRREEPRLVVWLAYSEELCAQAAGEFERSWASLGNREVSVYRYWGPASLSTAECHDGIVIAGLAKTYARAKEDLQFLSKLSDRADLVVIDEAHQAIAETYHFVLSTLIDRRAGVGLLGLSATPGRTWNDPQQDLELAEFFGRRKVTLSTPPLNPVDYLISEGYLARPDFVSLPYAGDQLTPSETAALARELEIPQSVLARLATDEQRNLIVVRSAEALLKRHQRVLLFAATVDHARTLATVLAGRGHEAQVVTGATPKGRRQQIIEDFRSPGGSPKILCNFGVLTTGFDAPSTSAAVIARPTKSLVLYSQMVGRAIRGPKAGGNKTAEIHTVVDSSLPGFGTMSEAFLNWEDVWEDENDE